ncbi:glycosyltransferase family A protein [uncultured Slackia sp.]|uniref:glycosyltransferase family 2 protein n=1 Tax=uncultured Slackia sp. TaxID=665903 RepID=UPI0025EC356A|nr:glycosyltransferase family A protein [uncultured Slackia sp.]
MRISVVIPTHFRPNTLCRAIDSVLSQTYPVDEVIVISDGVDPLTTDIVNRYKRNDDKVIYVEFPTPRGANCARNVGVSLASGDWIAFLDDDDEWQCSKIESQVRAINENPGIGIVWTGVRQIYSELGVSYDSLPSISSSGKVSDILIKNYIGTTSSVLLKKDVFREAGGFDEELPALQDYDLWIRVVQITRGIAVPSAEVLYYCSFSSNQISASSERYELSFRIIGHKYREQIGCLSDSEKLERSVSIVRVLLEKKMRSNDKTGRVELLKELVSLKPILGIEYAVASLIPYRILLKIRALRTVRL